MLADFLDRSVTIEAAGRTFTVRPVTVVGMVRAQQIMAKGAADATERGAVGQSWLDDLKAAVAAKDAARASSLLAEILISALDALGVERLARLLALVTTPADAGVIGLALQGGATRQFIEAVAAIHDLRRLVNHFLPHDDVIPSHVAESDGIGLETSVINVCRALQAYRIEDVLAWPYERLLAAQEQIGLIRRLEAGRPSTERPKAATAAQLRGLGIKVETAH